MAFTTGKLSESDSCYTDLKTFLTSEGAYSGWFATSSAEGFVHVWQHLSPGSSPASVCKTVHRTESPVQAIQTLTYKCEDGFTGYILVSADLRGDVRIFGGKEIGVFDLKSEFSLGGPVSSLHAEVRPRSGGAGVTVYVGTQKGALWQWYADVPLSDGACTATAKLVNKMPTCHTGPIRCISSHAADSLFTGSDDGTVAQWRRADYGGALGADAVRVIDSHKNDVLTILAPASHTDDVVSAGKDGRLRWTNKDGKELFALTVDAVVRQIAGSGDTVYAAMSDGTVRSYTKTKPLAKGGEIRQVSRTAVHSGQATGAALVQDGTTAIVFTCGADGAIHATPFG